MLQTPPMESTKGHQRHESGPIRGLLRVQPQLRPHPLESHESNPGRGLLKAKGSRRSCGRGHQRHKGGPAKGLPMVTHYQSHLHQGSGLTRGLLMVQPQFRPHLLENHVSDPSRGLLKT